jgi:hypothetical protein
MKKSIVIAMIIFASFLLLIGIYILIFTNISQKSSGEIITRDIEPYHFNGSVDLTAENLQALAPNVLTGKNARYFYIQTNNYGSVGKGTITSVNVYTFNNAQNTQEFLDQTKFHWDERNLNYSSQSISGKKIYVFTYGDQNQFMWAHENHLIQITIDRENGLIAMDKGFEVRDAYIKKYS